MSKTTKLLEAVRNNPRNVRFTDFVRVIEAFGYRFARANGSHQLYKLSDTHPVLNIQDKNGMAKGYQVEQFLDVVETYALEVQ